MPPYITNAAIRQETMMRARLRKYGLEPADYARMRDRQHNKCAICERHASHGKELVVDHDHATGAVRSLLCSRCNTALGMMTDNAAHLRRAADYLEQHGSKPKARGTGEELVPVKKHTKCFTCGYKGKPDRLRSGQCQRCRSKQRRQYATTAERTDTDSVVDEAGNYWDIFGEWDEYDMMAIAIERSGER